MTTIMKRLTVKSTEMSSWMAWKFWLGNIPKEIS